MGVAVQEFLATLTRHFLQPPFAISTSATDVAQCSSEFEAAHEHREYEWINTCNIDKLLLFNITFNMVKREQRIVVSITEAVSAETAKIVAEVDQHNMDLDSDPFPSDVEDEAIIEDE